MFYYKPNVGENWQDLFKGRAPKTKSGISLPPLKEKDK